MNETPTPTPLDDARDRVLDALLIQHLTESTQSTEARYQRAFIALDAAREEERRAPLSLRTSGRARDSALRLSRAALLMFAAIALLMLTPVHSSATMILAETMTGETRAFQGASDRRYEVAVLLQAREARNPIDDNDVWLRGTWDLRGRESRLDLGHEGFATLTRVDSVDGAWEKPLNGTARTLDSRELWPRWIEERDGRIAVERMDALLRLVQRDYDAAFARAGSESSVYLRGAMHIVASRRGDVRGPDEIELWIDTQRNVVLEARLRWSDAGPRAGSPTRDARFPPRDGPPPRDGSPPRDGPPPRDGSPPRDGPPSRGAPPFDAGPPPHGGRPPDGGPPPDDDYRRARGALPPTPPRELRLRRIEPISFPADHFTMPVAK
jgi:hypothetical protein